MNKRKLRDILDVLSPEGTSTDFKEFDANVAKLKDSLKQKIQVKTLEDVNTQFNTFRRSLNFTPLFTSIENIEKSLDAKIANVSELLRTETTDFQKLLKENNGVIDSNLEKSIASLKEELTGLKAQKDGEIKDLRTRINELPDFVKRVDDTFASMRTVMAEDKKQDAAESKKLLQTINDGLEKLRKELTNRINNFPHGGNANRDIRVGGAFVLTPFTDINLKAGSNVTITYSTNQATKFTDITFASTGGGGTIRSINSISTSQTAGATAGTDYVYICSGTITLTLPTAVGNTNLYTVKNAGTGIITVDTTSSQTIDGDLTITMPVKYTSVDLISDGSNWQIT